MITCWVVRTLIVYVAYLFFIPIDAFNQDIRLVCKDTLQAKDPEFNDISKWIKNEIEPNLKQGAVVAHHLLSAEALSFNWDKYPSLNLIYHYTLSSALKEVGAYAEAEKAGQIALQIDAGLDTSYAPSILSLLGSIAIKTKDYKSAIDYYQRNYEFTRHSDIPFAVLGALNNLGLTYFYSDSLDKAESLFLQAYHTYVKDTIPPQSLLVSLLDNLADIALVKNDTLKAIQLLHRKDSVVRYHVADTLRAYDTWVSLADLYVALGLAQKAIPFIRDAETLITQFPKIPAEDQYHLAHLRYRYELVTQNHDAAVRSMEKLQHLREKAKEEERIRHQTEVEVLHQYADYNVRQERELALIRIEKKEREKKYQQRLTLLAILSGIISLAGLYVYFSFRQKVNKQRIEGLQLSVNLNTERLKREELEKELLQKNLEASEKELMSIAMENVRRKEWTREMMEKLSSIIEKPSEHQTEGFKKLYHQLLHESQIQERMSLAHENEELIQTSFVHQLKSSYPDLSSTEIDLCILIRLGLTGKEIAIVRNIDPESIRKSKYRLRQKMSLASPEELTNYLFSISKN